ncbi:MAG: hypothetical protein AABY22_29120 [Nanoarchaeota archaeon]
MKKKTKKQKSLEKIHKRNIKKLHPDVYSLCLLNGAVPAPELKLNFNDSSW